MKDAKLIKNTLIIAIGRVMTKLTSFLLLPLYTSIIDPYEYGIYELYISVAMVVSCVIDLSLDRAMLRYMIDAETKQESDQIVSSAARMVAKNILLMSVIFFVISFFVKIPYAIYLYLFIIAYILDDMRGSFLRGRKNIPLFSFTNFLFSLIVIIINFICVKFLNIGIKGLLISHFIAGFVVGIYSLMKEKVDFNLGKNNKKDVDKKLINYGVPLIPQMIGYQLMLLTNKGFLTSLFDTAAVSIYAMALKLPSAMSTIASFFNMAWAESAFTASKDEDRETYYRQMTSFYTNMLYTGSAYLLIAISLFFPYIIKNDYQAAYIYIPLALLSSCMSCKKSFLSNIFGAYKNTVPVGKASVISSILNLILSVLLIGKYKIWGAIVALTISTIFEVVYLMCNKKEGPKSLITKDTLLNALKYALATILFYKYRNLGYCIMLGMIEVGITFYQERRIITRILNKL